jgi:hypothetical protein
MAVLNNMAWRLNGLAVVILAGFLAGCAGDYPHMADEDAPPGTYEGEVLTTCVYESLHSPETYDYDEPHRR